MPCIAVVTLNCHSTGFTNHVPFFGKHLGKNIPIVRIIGAMLYFVVESSKRCNITTAEYPGDSFPRAAINGLNEPKLVFFELIKCHISSNSISLISPSTEGYSKDSPASFIRRYIRERSLLNIVPSMLYIPLARAYNNTTNDFRATTFSLVLSSPTIITCIQ